MNGIPSIENALYSKLTGAAGVTALVSTRVYNLQAPSGATLPYIVFNLVANNNLNLTFNDIWRGTYRVACWSDTSAKASGDIADAVYTALHQATLSISGGWVNHWTRGTRRAQLVEQEGAKQYYATVLDIQIEVS